MKGSMGINQMIFIKIIETRWRLQLCTYQHRLTSILAGYIKIYKILFLLWQENKGTCNRSQSRDKIL